MKKALKNKKGFTLIEIIVVLVILAILAAAAIPSMMGFVEDARGKALVAEARAAYIAVQALVSEDRAVHDDPADYLIESTGGIVDVVSLNAYQSGRLTNMLAPDIAVANIVAVRVGEVGGDPTEVGVITGLKYHSGDFWIVLEPGIPAAVTKGAATPLYSDETAPAPPAGP